MWRNRIIALVMIVLSFILISIRGGAASYLFFYASLFVPVLSLIYVHFVYLRFHIYQAILSKTILKGQNVAYEFQLSNEDIITYAYVSVHFFKGNSTVEKLDMENHYCLIPGELVKKDTNICCHYRGFYNVGIQTVQVSDFLRLFTINYPIRSKINVTVLPRILIMEQFLLDPDTFESKKMKQSSSIHMDMPDVETRKYMFGDSLRQIHWKASAKSQELVSRKYMEESKTEVTIVVDFMRMKEIEHTRLILEDKIIEGTLAIAYYFLTRHIDMSILLEEKGVQLFQIYQQSDFDALYQLCAYTEFEARYSLSVLLAESYHFIENKGYFMIITAQITEELKKSCFLLLEAGNSITIIYMESNDSKQTSEPLLLDSRIQLLTVPFYSDILKVLEGTSENE